MAFGEAQVRRWLVARLARRLARPESAIGVDRRFDDLGLGSRDMVEITGELQERLDRLIAPALVYAHPTIAALARACTQEDGPQQQPGTHGAGAGDVPVAVIGLGCRLPGGVSDATGFWESLTAGRSGIGEVPDDRWETWQREEPAVARLLGGTRPRGGFLTGDVAEFDADAFGIAPREAASMDPQQRLALEVAHESLQHSGIAPGTLAGSRTGVFMGASTSDYGQLLFRDLTAVDAWTGTGASPSIIANRLSYWLGAHGPSLVVDTACSSSLVAVHLAARSLRAGESDLALAGGVNLILSPGVTVNFSRAGAMAADGRCKTFDASADGYGRGEGCGVVVLKRLPDALRDGDRVLAVLRGSAINSDGPSNGLMAPNPSAQEAVLRAACADAGVEPGEIDYVEAHGTGTMLGDPIEARALGRALGSVRAPDAPLLVGSVKSNLGHLEAAAGVAGLIKVVLALAHGTVPPSLNFDEPNPHIDFQAERLRVVTRGCAWPGVPAGQRPARAGVSSFGFGGSNAHAVLESAPAATEPAAEEDGRPGIYCLPGSDQDRVRTLAAALADRLDEPEGAAGLADTGFTLARRTAGPCTTVVAGSRSELLTGLRSLAAGRPGPETTVQVPVRMGAGPVWVFPGQGSQWTGMAQRLLADEPAFAAAVDELDPLFVREARYSLRRLIERGRPLTGIDRIQPVIFGVQVALAALWRAHGVEPAAVIGHSMGEVAAAVVAGGLTPADGVAVMVRRSRLLARTAGRGAMALVEVSEPELRELAPAFPGVQVAGHVAPGQTTVAGDPQAVQSLVEHLQARRRLARLVRVDVASHSSHMDPLLDDLTETLRDITGTGQETCSFYSTVLDDPREAPKFDAAYWAANLRRPVRFEQAVRAAADVGDCFVEISPHPILTYAAEETLRAEGSAEPLAVPTLRRDCDERQAFRAGLARLIAAGHRPAPGALHPAGRVIDLPTAPWRRERHWFTAAATGTGLPAPEPGTLLGSADVVAADPPIRTWRALHAPEAPPYPGEHTVDGVPVVPASVLLNTALRAAGGGAVAGVRLIRPVIADGRVETQVTEQDGLLRLSVRPGGQPDAGWTASMTARITEAAPGAVPAGLQDGEHLTGTRADELLASSGAAGRGYDWRVVEARRAPGGLDATVDLPGGTAALLDAALQLAALAGRDGFRMPAGAAGLTCADDPPERVRIHVRRAPEHQAGQDDDLLDIVAAAPDGDVVLSLAGVRYAALESDRVTEPAIRDPQRLVFAPFWEPIDLPEPPPAPPTVAIAGPRGPFTERLAAMLSERGSRVHHLGADEPAHADAVVIAPPETATAVTDTLAVIRGMAGTARLWLTTRGVRTCDDAAALLGAPLWGLAEVAAAELPGQWGGLVDLGDDDEATLATLAAVVAGPSREPLAIESGTPSRRRLAPLTGSPPGAALRCRPDAAYLVTGGLGALGLETARWLAGRGARRLILAGRTPLPPRSEWAAADRTLATRLAAIRELEERGVAVQAVAMDTADDVALARLLRERDEAGLPPVRGIVHAAGTTGDRSLLDLDEETARSVLRPKVDGLQALEAAFLRDGARPLDFLILYSSAGSLLGVPGQGAYAAASSFLDAFARRHRSDRTRVMSLNWGPWDGLGMAADAELVAEQTRAAGLRPLRVEEAFLALDHLYRHGAAHALIVAPGTTSSDAPEGLLADVVAAAPAAEPEASDLDWAAFTPDELRPALAGAVRAAAAAELGRAAADIEDSRPLAELGMDSIMGLALRRRLERLTGLALSATTLWNHPTVEALTELMGERLTPGEDGPPAPETPPGPDDDHSWSALLGRVEEVEIR